VSPNLPAQVPGLLDEIAASSKQYLGAEPQARLKLLETARSLVYALETPREAHHPPLLGRGMCHADRGA
jgi:hypothetical protein